MGIHTYPKNLVNRQVDRQTCDQTEDHKLPVRGEHCNHDLPKIQQLFAQVLSVESLFM